MSSIESLLSDRVLKLKPSPTLAIDAKAKMLKAQGIDIVNLSAGEPDFDTPKHIKEAAIEAINQGFTKYTPVAGIVELREAICNKLKTDYDIEYSVEEIVVSTGGKQGLFNVIQAIVNPGDEVIIPVPYWVSYPPMVELAGGRPVYLQTYPEDNFGIDIDSLKKLITQKTKAIILNSPSNPTGAIYSEELLTEIAKLSIEKNFLIITDDIYDQIRFDGKSPYNCVSLVKESKDHVIIANGVSKTYAMTGWRIGYLAGPQPIIKAATKIQSQSTSNPNSIAQKAALSAFTGPQDCVKEMAKAFKGRRDYIVNRLNNMENVSTTIPEGAFYVFPDFSKFYGKSVGDKKIEGSLSLADYLLEDAKIAAVPGVAFGDDHFIRFSFATDMENLKKGMDRLEAALKEIK